MTREEYEAMLIRLAAMLKTNPMTARQIAKRMKCGKPAAYRRIRALQLNEFRVYETHVRERATGPLATAYGVR
jgi:hypothetical protein